MKKIILEKSKCIGCGTCEVLCPKFFEMKDGKSHLKDSKENSNKDEELEVEKIECAKDVVDACPAQCVKIK
ncbi:ferredoxin [Candidatus Parcubacteria bacterium]|jgi:ferredoxin|nr:ferredoxin [Candidatus Parcubacteria bacterium]